MRKIASVLSVFIVLFISTWALAAPPLSGDKVFVVGSDGPFIATISGDMLSVQVPIPGSQAKLPQAWTLSTGVRAYFGEKGWGEHGATELVTTATDKYLKAQIKLNGSEAYRVRIWGKNSSNNAWLHIVQSDTYTRLDKNNEPAYELVVADGKVQTVPTSYGKWSW